MRTKGSLADTEDTVATCVINERGKTSNYMSSEEQAAQSVGKSSKIVVANIENDESTNVDIDIQIEIPPAQMGFIKMLAYKRCIKIGLTKTVYHPTACMVERARPN